MLSGETLSQFNLRNLTIWSTLAFQAGSLNAGGYLACHRFVTHTTGFATLFGTDIARGEFSSAMGMLSVPLFFLGGAMLSAVLVDRRKLQGKTPFYRVALSVILLTLIFIVIAGHNGYWGTFGEPLFYLRDYVLLALLSFTSGVQNAMITSMSGSVLRTTHLTGLTTDLGIGLVRILSNQHKRSRDQEMQATIMRSAIIGFFILGSLCSGWIFLAKQYSGFLIPTVVCAILLTATFWMPTREPSP